MITNTALKYIYVFSVFCYEKFNFIEAVIFTYVFFQGDNP